MAFLVAPLATALRFRRGGRARPRPFPASPTAAFRHALPWLLVGLLLTLLPLIGQVPLWSLGVFTGCTAWRYLLERNGRMLPSMVARLLVFVPVTLLILKTFGLSPTATGLLTFLIALLSLKVLELRSARDFTIVALLSYFMVLSAFFYNQSFGLSIYLGVVIVINSVALIRCHAGALEGWPALRLALGMGAQAVPLVIVLFVVFPRIQASFFQRIGLGNTGQTGMSDTLQPGSFSSLVQSNDLVFRARLLSPKPVEPGQLYWRGLVLEICEHPMSWHVGPQPGIHYPRDTPVSPDDITQQIQLIPNGTRWLFALDQPVGLKPLANFRDLKPMFEQRTGTLHSSSALDHQVIYHAFSTLRAVDLSPMDERLRKRFVTVPDNEISPRIRELVQSWRKGKTCDEDVVRAASRFFETNNFTYTLTPGLLRPEGALDQFLFSSRRGFCEHYAAAFSTLMRVAGIPARVVVGYQGGELNRWDPHYTIRQSDAHAWSEVWLEGRGWVREDPTALVAPERVSYGAENFAALDGTLDERGRLDQLNEFNARPWRWLVRNAGQAWDSVDEQWNLLVLGFDQDSQLTVFEKLGLGSMDWLGRTLVTLLIVFSVLALGAGLIFLADRKTVAGRDPVRRLYERFCRKLTTRTGLRRSATEGPLDFARRASGALTEQSTEIRRITDLYVAARYAAGTSTETLTALREAVARFHVRQQRG